MSIAPSLLAIARALGGDVCSQQVLAPGPGHSSRDRSLSVRLSPHAPDGFVVHSFSGDDWRRCADYVREKLGLPAFGKSGPEFRERTRAAAKEKPQENTAVAAWLWERREPLSETNAAGIYLRKRNFAGAFPQTLGFLPASDKYPPAMIAAFGFCEEPEPRLLAPPATVRGVHLTRLTPSGDKTAEDDPAKIMIGPMAGLPIVLAPVNDLLGLAITEGIEDGLSVLEETWLGIWAAGSAGNMPSIAAALPAYVECATIFAHLDEAGMRFGKEAATIIRAKGIEVHLKGRG